MKDEALHAILIQRQLLDQNLGDRLLARAKEANCLLEEVLIQERAFTADQLLRILENHYFCPAVRLSEFLFDPSVLTQIPRKTAVRHMAFPLDIDGDSLRVALAEPDNRRTCEDLRLLSGKPVIPVVALRHEIRDAINVHYSRLDGEMASAESRASVRAAVPCAVDSAAGEGHRTPIRLNLHGKEPSVIVDELIRTAYEHDAADIHVEPGEIQLTFRLRMDGILRDVAHLPVEAVPSITSRIKIMSGMDIAERRLPQDGRFSLKIKEDALDMRVSCLPSQYGEKIVIRLLAKRADLLVLDNLDMPVSVRKEFDEAITNSQGFYLVTGPTGSGKTTTLYATLNALDKASTNIVTLEDPIEYSLPGIIQVQIHEDIGLTFAAGLRSILRQDPDVILVGEIRDAETVEIACRAALTGHKVFSTIHTNDACQAITRLTDMGVPPYLISATLRGVLAQRLIRRLCSECKEEYEANETELAVLGYPKVRHLHRWKGCAACGGLGYKGRMAIYEHLRLDESLHRLILERASPYAIRHAARRNGMILMSEFAKRAVLEGLTTVAEIQRAVLFEEGREQLCLNCQRVVSIEYSNCPFCQHVLKEKCANCGGPVEANWEACASCGHEIEREWQKIFCRHCLAPVSPDWESCHYCGGDLHLQDDAVRHSHHAEMRRSGGGTL